MNNRLSGKIAETLAVIYFALHGFRIVKRNYVTGKRTGAGEIDLIVKRKNLLVFTEVKKRANLDIAAYAILPKQQQRIWKAAENFVKKHPQFENFDIRFDAFLVSSNLTFKHIADAWRQ